MRIKKINRVIAGTLAAIMIASSAPMSALAVTMQPEPVSSIGTVDTGQGEVVKEDKKTEFVNENEKDTNSPAEQDNVEEDASKEKSDLDDFIPLSPFITAADEKLIIGESVDIVTALNRKDVPVEYQWQVKQLNELKNRVTEEDIVAKDKVKYEYAMEESLAYRYLLADFTEEQALKENPDATWPGCELYFAVKDAAEAAGYTEAISLENGTSNYVLLGYDVSADVVDGILTVTYKKGDSTFTSTIDTETGMLKNPEEVVENEDWKDIEGEISNTLHIDVTEDTSFNMYRCVVTPDIEYTKQYIEYLKAEGQNMDGAVPEEYTVTTGELRFDAVSKAYYEKYYSVKDPGPEFDNVFQKILYWIKSALSRFWNSVRHMFSRFTALFVHDAEAADNIRLSDDGKYIIGFTTYDWEYISKDWYNENSSDAYRANSRAWTNLRGGYRMDGTRYYRIEQTMHPTYGRCIPVLSDWYGKTLYFRTPGKSGTGIEVKVPALTKDTASFYKESVRVLEVFDALTAGAFYSGTLINRNAENTTIHMISIPIDSPSRNQNAGDKITDINDADYRPDFNENPEFYLYDAEYSGLYDSVLWGPFTSAEPDLSGRAYAALKEYLAKGYGFMIGHDTMYTYPGSWNDAMGNSIFVPNVNDGKTYYYSSQDNWHAARPMHAHYYMNELMGWNGGYYKNDAINSKNDALQLSPSGIISAGGEFKTGKFNILYGGNKVRIKTMDYTPEQAKNNVAYRQPTNYPFATYQADSSGVEQTWHEGAVFDASVTHTNSQMAYGTIWADYAETGSDFSEMGITEPIISKNGGTNNFYLSGNENFLMNQIGHQNSNIMGPAYIAESRLLYNSIMYISQRKQCEVCQSQQGSVEPMEQKVHFVHRINEANANRIFSTLQAGGNIWFPLNDCYMLESNVVLPDGWTGIENFSGHFNANGFTISFPEGSSGKLFIQSDSGNWNLGTNPTGPSVPSINNNGNRTTGVARVVGFLHNLLGGDGEDYANYMVKFLVSDNPGKLTQDYTSIVNSDGKYAISNLPCIYNPDDEQYILVARVYSAPDANGHRTEIVLPNNSTGFRADVKETFWDTDMTTTLYLSNASAEPVVDKTVYTTGGAVFEAKTKSVNPITVREWQYRETADSSWKTLPSSWNYSSIDIANEQKQIIETIGSTQIPTGYSMTSKLHLNNISKDIDGYQFRAIFSGDGVGEWSSHEYYQNGTTLGLTPSDGDSKYTVVSTFNKTGKLTVLDMPFNVYGDEDKTVYEGTDVEFTSTMYGVYDTVSVRWQYGEDKNDIYIPGNKKIRWNDMDESRFGPIEIVKNETSIVELDPANGETAATIYHELENLVKKEHSGESLTESQIKSFVNEKFGASELKKTETTIRVKKLDMSDSDVFFRAVFDTRSTHGVEEAVYSSDAHNLSNAWTTKDKTFGDNYPTTKESFRSRVTVIPPIIRTVTYKSGDFEEGRPSADNSTPDEYGQKVTVKKASDNIASGTAVYKATVYYKPDETQHIPTPSWQYITYMNRTPKEWNEDVAHSLGYTDLRVSFENSAPYPASSEEWTGYYAVDSKMTLSNIPSDMFNVNNLLKYYFRCTGTMEYETSKKTASRISVGKWGGLTVDYDISLKHNGVLAYGGVNIINGTEVHNLDEIKEATDGRASSTWKYPNLKIDIPSGQTNNINTVILRFEDGVNSKDSINIDTGALNAYGMQLVHNDGKKVVISSRKSGSVSAKSWEEYLREHVSFTVYEKANYVSGGSGSTDGTANGANIFISIDEANLTGTVMDPDTGHVYKMFSSNDALTWNQAKERASAYNSAVGLEGYLAEINTDSENNIVKQLMGRGDAWIGGKRERGAWRWDRSDEPFKVWHFANGYPHYEDGYYAAMTSDGSWKSYMNTSTIRQDYTFTNMIKGFTKSPNWNYITTPTWHAGLYANWALGYFAKSYTGDPNAGGMTDSIVDYPFSYDRSYRRSGGWIQDTSLGEKNTQVNNLTIYPGVEAGYDAHDSFHSNTMRFRGDHIYYVQFIPSSVGHRDGVLRGLIATDDYTEPKTSWANVRGGGRYLGPYRQIVNLVDWLDRFEGKSGGEGIPRDAIIRNYSGEGVANILHAHQKIESPNYSNPLCELKNFSVIDMTEAFGSNENMKFVLEQLGYSMSDSGIKNFVEKEVNKDRSYSIWMDSHKYGVNTLYDSVTIELNKQVQTDIYSYIVEYDYDPLSIGLSNKGREDTDTIGTGTQHFVEEKLLTVKIEDNKKEYDGTPITPSSFTVSEDRKDLVQIHYEQTSGKSSSYINKTVSGQDWADTDAINAGTYHVTVSLTDEAIANHWALDMENSKIECDLNILPCPLTIESTGNDKVYDGTSDATIGSLDLIGVPEDSSGNPIDNIVIDTWTPDGHYVDKNDKNQIHVDTLTPDDPTSYPEYTIVPDAEITLGNNENGNYEIAIEHITGTITPRPLDVVSKYQGNEISFYDPATGTVTKQPIDASANNIKPYDTTTKAIITDFYINNFIKGDSVGIKPGEYKGNYSTHNAAETLIEDSNGDGKAQTSRFEKLGELTIKLDKPLTASDLSNNEHGDYIIGGQDYSGSIYRAPLWATIKSTSANYGDPLPEKPTSDDIYTANTRSNSWLNIIGLKGTDILAIISGKNPGPYKSEFVVEEFKTDGDGHVSAGTSSSVTYIGLNEHNYDVLKNYIVYKTNGGVNILPKDLIIRVDGGYEKAYLSENPEFGVTYEGFVYDDTPEKCLGGNLVISTVCDVNSPILYKTDENGNKIDVEHLPGEEHIEGSYNSYKVSASGLECLPNIHGGYNYNIIYVDGDITVKEGNYTIHYDGNGSTEGTIMDSIHTLNHTEKLHKNAYARSYTVKYDDNHAGAGPIKSVRVSYLFRGWAGTKESAKTNWPDSSFKTGTQMNPITNTSSFMTDESYVKNMRYTKPNDSMTLYAVWQSSSTTLPDASRRGHQFEGWYLDKNCTPGNFVGDAGDEFIPSADVTLYAKWKPVNTLYANIVNTTDKSPYNGTKTFRAAENGQNRLEIYGDVVEITVEYPDKLVEVAEYGQNSGTTGDCYLNPRVIVEEEIMAHKTQFDSTEFKLPLIIPVDINKDYANYVGSYNATVTAKYRDGTVLVEHPDFEIIAGGLSDFHTIFE